ncbi:trichohyalin isoform X2 [Silurus asotus]|uniref:Trichohyalin isoform X2 n=1 Tax=Silurus asotus TaxID=30991 RepID=A0AAD5FE37_SILAS|nr:trichohyalin isoform X2 [Silurus asotus]
MDNSNHDGADDTDELLSIEVISDFCPTRDHCDMLLDAIDAQLSRLQVKETLVNETCSLGQAKGENGKREDILGSVSLDRTTSISKDTGLGTDKASSAADVLTSDQADLTTVENSKNGMERFRLQENMCEENEAHEGQGTATEWPTGGAGGDRSSKREQCLWRLERLLGTGTGQVARKEDGDEEDSVRTEDFSARFLEEMLEPTKLSTAGSVPDFSAPDSASISSDATLITEPHASNRHKGNQNPSVVSFQNPSRQLAGVSLKSFDLVTIDSDLDSVCTERVRHHLQSSLTNSIGTVLVSQEGFLENGSRAGRIGVKTTEGPENRRERSELNKLQAQRDLYIQEVRALQESQAALQRHMTTIHHDSSPRRYMNSGCVSALEREEMDHLLDKAKSELFSEQRRFRHTLETMQERLEEVNQGLEQKQEENRKLKEKCSKLEQKLITATKTRQDLQEVGSLSSLKVCLCLLSSLSTTASVLIPQSVQKERVEQEGRLGALEKIVAQKELLLLAAQEEKNHLEMEIRAVREEHSAKLTASISHAQKQKMKEEEVNRLEECLKQQQEELRKREEELRGEMQEQLPGKEVVTHHPVCLQVKRVMAQEQKKWEEQRAESVRELQARLEKQMQEAEKRGKAEVEKEKRGALELQNKELDRAASKQTVVIRALREEHQTEIYKLRRQLQQEAEGEAVRLKKCVRHSEAELQAVRAELQGMRAELAERGRLQQEAEARHEQLNAGWAQDIHTECEHIEELSSFNRARLHEDDEGLRRQLRAKDEELRQVQRNMVQWKEKTMARLARKFEQELTSELDRKPCRHKSDQRRRLEQLEGEMRHLTASSSEITDIPPSSTSSTHLPDTANTRDLDSFKLLRHLQSRIRQLQADAQSQTHTYTPNVVRLHRDRRNTELAGSYLETVCNITMS